ncbi:hypothetical protein BH10ACT1_BH10ACT1_01400 [soil metagenome]
MSTAPQLEEPTSDPVDGRTARAVRTRDRLVDATIALVEEGDLRPTAPRIAERAGVSVRSVFQHFDDLDSLFAAMGARVVERLAVLITPIDPDAPLVERVAEFVRQRCEVAEAVSPINRAAILQAPRSTTIGRQFASGHGFVAALTAEVFEPELEAAGEHRAALLDGLVVAGSWPTWNLLRTLEHRSVHEATASVQALFALLLGLDARVSSHRPVS